MSYKRKVEVLETRVVVLLLDEMENELASNDMLLSAADKETIDLELVKLAVKQDDLSAEAVRLKSKKKEIETLYPGVADLEAGASLEKGIDVPPEPKVVEVKTVKIALPEDAPLDDVPLPE